MSEYPEHIDQIDDFYRSQLADHEIAPPDGLWDKISMGAFESQGPQASASDAAVSSAAMFTKTQKVIGGLSLITLLIIVGSLYFYFNKPNTTPSEKNTIPTNQPIEEQKNDTSAPDSLGSEHGTISPSSHTQHNTTQHPTSINKKREESIDNSTLIEKQPEETKVDVTEIAPSVIEEKKADSMADIKTVIKAPKEKVKFKDKYKKEYQDSTRKLFVPGK